MFKREYHSYSEFYKDKDALPTSNSFAFTIRSFCSYSAKDIVTLVTDQVKGMNQSDGKVIIHSITRLK